ncbi:hypothetical protein NC651_016501 [Populus alba x Populus x berolinensis]|nr:hypothetical protein NC651_016501 [Populus alba x Populus x berolinensis]
MLCPLPPARLSPLKELAGGSSPDKYLIYSKDGFVLQHIDSSPSAEDHVLIEDCFDEDDFEEDEVDYSTTKGRSKFFLSPVPNPTGKPMDATLGIGLRATPLDAPEKLERDRPSLSTTKSPIRATSSGFAMAEAGSLVIAPHAEASQLGTSHPLEPIGKWRDLFASNCNTVSSPKLMHFSSSDSDSPCVLSNNDLDNNYDIWHLCLVGYVAGKSLGFKALNSIISSTWRVKPP